MDRLKRSSTCVFIHNCESCLGYQNQGKHLLWHEATIQKWTMIFITVNEGAILDYLVCHISPLMRNYSTLILNTRHYINPLSSIHYKEQAIQCSMHDLYNSTAHINVYLMLNPIFIWGEQCIRQDFATKPLLLLIYAYCLSTTQQIPLKFCTKWA